MLVNLEDPSKKQDPGLPLLQLGFRPFFLLAGISAILLIGIWGLVYSDGGPNTVYDPVYWHGHEMLFGYVAAVVAGFLLTAVKNWTGRQTLNGFPLLLLFLLWLSARVLPFFPLIPYWVTASIDLLFLPALATAILPLLLKTKNHRNLIFVGIIILFAVANAVFHLGAAGIVQAGEAYGLYAAAYTVFFLISVMGGRVIPFFIERGVGNGFVSKKMPAIDVGASSALLLLGIMQTADITGIATALVALLAAILHTIRLRGWYSNGVWRVPLLWVLVLAYAWIIAGLFLLSMAMFGLLPQSLALHAMTVGGIGVMTMGMMVRVSMGHSGRNLSAPGLLPAAFVALNVAVVVRVLLPLLLPEAAYPSLIVTSALIWAVAFAVFVFYLTPVYFSARPDGRPG